MPKITLPVPEVNLSVTRPVVLEVVRQLMKDTGLSSKTTIFFPGDHERGPQPNSLISETDESNMFPFNDRITIEVEENYEQERILSAAVFRPEHLFVLRDDRIELGIKPVYSSTDMTINIKYRAKDKTSATRWRDDMRTRIGMGRDVRYHSFSYHYLVPPEFFVILQELHRMREAVDGYGEDYDTYLKANMSQRVSLLTNLAGEQGQWGVSETQRDVLGYYDFDGVPEQGSKDDEGDTWTISVSYKFKYEKPIECAMFYPLMIHNQLVEKYRPMETVDTWENHIDSYSQSVDAFNNFRKVVYIGRTQGVAIPSFDDFIPASVIDHTYRVLTALTNIDTSDGGNPSLLMNFGVLPDMDLDPAVLRFMAQEAPYMTKLYQSILQVSLYRNKDLLTPGALSVSNTLDVSATQALSLRDYHHVRLSVVTDLRLLPMPALNRLRENGDALQILLDYIAPWLKDMGLLPPILANNYVARADLEKAIDAINSGLLAQGNGQSYQFNTVGTLFVEASQRSA